MMKVTLICMFSTLSLGASDLVPSSELENGCLNFPAENFNRLNNIKAVFGESPLTHLNAAKAIDFTLHDIDGNSHNLGDELLEKPVALIWGSWTSPELQSTRTETKNYPENEASYQDEWDLVDQFKDRVTFMHLVGPESNPAYPDTSPIHGLFDVSYWSTLPQSKTYDGRVQATQKIKDMIHPDAILLPDYVAGNPYKPDANQPVWCTMGLGSRTSMLISTQGQIVFQQQLLHKSDFIGAIEKHFA